MKIKYIDTNEKVFGVDRMIEGIPVIGINKAATKKLNDEIKVLAVEVGVKWWPRKFWAWIARESTSADGVLMRYKSDYDKQKKAK